MNKYKYVFNKIFTSGKYLDKYLGHEIINFLVMDDKKRYVYINAWGGCNKEARLNTEYALHVMEVMYDNKKYHELVAVSKIIKNTPGLYKNRAINEDKDILKYKNHLVSKIFDSPIGRKKAHLYTFIASNFYKVKGLHIYFNINSDNSSEELIKDKNGNIIINVKTNPCRNSAYSLNSDIKVLDKLIKSDYLVEEKEEEVYSSDDELCFSVISDRTKLENSTSNQIAYFLGQDDMLLKSFLNMLNKDINLDDEYEICREEKNIDILIKSSDSAIVIENKIDSNINGSKEIDKNTNLLISQLSDYYNYINSNNFKNMYFYILVPKYNSINEEELKKYLHGDKYKIVYYDELYNLLKDFDYKVFGVNPSLRSKFLFDEFKYNIEYIKSVKSEQQMKIAYIRLNQRLKELDIKDGIPILSLLLDEDVVDDRMIIDLLEDEELLLAFNNNNIIELVDDNNNSYIPLFTDERQAMKLDYTRLDRVKIDVVIRDIYNVNKYRGITINPYTHNYFLNNKIIKYLSKE